MSIKIEDLTYKYMPGTPFEKTAIDSISLEIGDGEFIGLIGHTGSGKSTLIQQLNGLLKPTSGRILVDDVNITDKSTDMRKIRQKVGLVFQYPEHQLFEETVYRDVSFGPANLGLDDEEINKRVRRAMKIVGLDIDEYKDKSPFDLSGGQRRRVAIAGVLAMEPEVLILDEPTAGLDPRGRDAILREIKNLHEEYRITVILVSHSMEDVAKLADRLIVMYKGKNILTGTPREVFTEIDTLEKIGLAVPQVTYLVRELNKKGYNVKSDVITIEEAKQELLKMLRRDKI
jgi:energy-coupling factor transport system ATP-binding protein